jgi:sialate O-acetylesterase
MDRTFNTRMARQTGMMALAAAILLASAHAAVSVPHIFSNDMVLQREMPIPVWGWADPGEKVTVALAETSAEATADADGNWKVALPAAKAGGPFTLTVTGKTTLTFTNVMVGEVWFCSGQSNMEMPINNLNKRDQYIKAGKFPNIRLFLIPHKACGMPNSDVEATWWVCTPENMRRFSAAGYFFGKEIHEQLNVPVGMICAAIGGSRIEPFTPLEGFAAVPQFANIVKEIERANQNYLKAYGPALERIEAMLPRAKQALAAGKRPLPLPELRHELENWGSSSAHNGMIAPIVPYAIRGALW